VREICDLNFVSSGDPQDREGDPAVPPMKRSLARALHHPHG
jgi:hypothetical protein